MKILYVEDDKKGKDLVSTFLKMNDLDVIDTDSPIKALEIIKMKK